MKHQIYNKESALASARVQMQLSNKRNLVLYLDKELVEKSRNLGFNLSKTFENHLKRLITQFSTCNSLSNFNSTENEMNMVGLPVPEPIWVQNLTQLRLRA
jgi:post-segregation antitoxin (ccd killing protein)